MFVPGGAKPDIEFICWSNWGFLQTFCEKQICQEENGGTESQFKAQCPLYVTFNFTHGV